MIFLDLVSLFNGVFLIIWFDKQIKLPIISEFFKNILTTMNMQDQLDLQTLTLGSKYCP